MCIGCLSTNELLTHAPKHLCPRISEDFTNITNFKQHSNTVTAVLRWGDRGPRSRQTGNFFWGTARFCFSQRHTGFSDRHYWYCSIWGNACLGFGHWEMQTDDCASEPTQQRPSCLLGELNRWEGNVWQNLTSSRHLDDLKGPFQPKWFYENRPSEEVQVQVKPAQ